MSEVIENQQSSITIDEIVNKLTEKGYLVYKGETDEDKINDDDFRHFILEKHSIYIHSKLMNIMHYEAKLALLIASQYLTLSDIAHLSYQTAFSVLKDRNKDIYYPDIMESIHHQLNRVYMYNNRQYGDKAILKLIETTKDFYFKVFFLDFKEGYLKKIGPFSLLANVTKIPTFCIKRNITMNAQNSNPINYEFNIDNVMRTLSRRYKFTSNNDIIYTNEITDKTRIYSIMDKNIVRGLRHYNNQTAFYNKNTAIINPNLSYFVEQYNNVIPLQHLFALFDIDEKELKNNLKKVWYLTNPIVCLGLGGLMSNFLYWCDKFREYFELDYVFKQLLVFEPDSLEFSNLFRITLNWRDLKVYSELTDNQLRQFMEDRDFVYAKQNHSKLMLLKSVRNLSPKIRQYRYRFTHINLKNCILIGGPDLDTRKIIFDDYANSDKYFICTTHSNNTVSIDAFPNFDRELTVETYGSIDLNKFLLNMFKMTVEIIRILANKEFVNKVQHKYLDYSVDNEDFITNSQKHKCLKNIAYAIN